MFVDQAIEDVQTTKRLSKGMAKTYNNVAESALFLTTVLCKEGIVHMVQVWLSQRQGSSMCEGQCVWGVRKAPPGMRPTYPLTKSEGPPRSLEFGKATEGSMPSLGTG